MEKNTKKTLFPFSLRQQLWIGLNELGILGLCFLVSAFPGQTPSFFRLFLFLCCWGWCMIIDWGQVVSPHSWEAERRKWREESRGVGAGGGVRHEESSFCGKNLLSLHMAHREDDKYSCSDRTMKKMVDESCSTECVNESMNGWKNEGLDERVDEWIAEKNMRVSPDVSSQYSAACLTSVWYLYPLLSARFFFFLFPAERPWFLWA